MGDPRSFPMPFSVQVALLSVVFLWVFCPGAAGLVRTSHAWKSGGDSDIRDPPRWSLVSNGSLQKRSVTDFSFPSAGSSRRIAKGDYIQGLSKVVAEFLKKNRANRPPQEVIYLSCGEEDLNDLQAFLRTISNGQMSVQVVTNPRDWEASVRRASSGMVTVLVDASCAATALFLGKASRAELYNPPHRWLLHNLPCSPVATALTTPPEYRPQSLLEDEKAVSEHARGCLSQAARLLAGRAVLPDSEVLLLVETSQRPSDELLLVSAYRISMKHVSLKLSIVGRWSGGAMRSYDSTAIAVQRSDLDGYVLNVVHVVVDPQNLKKSIQDGSATTDFMPAYFWVLVESAAEMLNATLNVTLTNAWGFLGKPGVPTTGKMGIIIRGEAEVGGSGIAMTTEPTRLKYLKFTNFVCPARSVIVFRAPPVSYENNLFTLPFPLSLWAAAGGVVVLSTLLMALVLRTEDLAGVRPITTSTRVGERDALGDHRGAATKRGAREAVHSTGDVILLVLGAICQQGYPLEARGVPGRVITLMLFLLLLLLYTTYSASIVMLMQSTSTDITHYRDLLNSRIEVGAMDAPYSVHYTKTEQDPERHRVYWEKMVDRGRRKGFYNLTEALQKVRTQYFAFMGVESTVFGEISRTWQEHEKCGLVQLHDFLRVKDPHLVISRTSHISEQILLTLRKIQERGIRARMNRKHIKSKPTCTSSATAFHSVSLTDCRGAFVAFMYLGALAVLVLFAELSLHRWCLPALRRGKQPALLLHRRVHHNSASSKRNIIGAR